MGENIIEIAGLRKSFDHVEVVKGVDMQVHQGEFLTLLGPSGCGKTTTLRMIAGFEEADSGSPRCRPTSGQSTQCFRATRCSR